jgi:hypothetical protein
MASNAKSAEVTSTQTILISNIGEGTLNWTATSGQSWLSVSPVPGAGTIYVTVNTSALSTGTWTGTITIADPDASNSPQTIPVTVNVYPIGATAPPIGYVDAPADGTMGLQGSIPVTGWAVDDVEVAKVEIWRDQLGGEAAGASGYVYLGNAVMIAGSRPDIEAAYPSYPFNDRAGWGYMLLSNVLPNGGNGYIRLHVIAYDVEGHSFELGSKAFVCDNADAVQPFGTIDSPEMGGTVSGSSQVNFAWALTPRPKMIPADGSTIWVWIDGVPAGHPVYNNYRADIATYFPGLANSLGAVGYYYLDTTRFADGLHSISWSVQDSAGATSGIGSRWFYISNSGSSAPIALGQAIASAPKIWPFAPVMDAPPASGTLRLREGFDPLAPTRLIQPGSDGVFDVELKEAGRMEVRLGDAGDWRALQILNGGRGSLPVGSSFDPTTGIFRWMPGPGFAGVYEFEFSDKSGASEGNAIHLRVAIRAERPI